MEMNYDDKELHQIEEELHTEILPGTEIMTDVGTHHFVKGSGSHQVLVPQPSADPNDPLNWSSYHKAAAITAASFVTFTQGFGPLALAPMFGYYMEEFNCTLEEAIQFTGVCILVLGFSNFFWSRATSYGSFMGACALNGFGAGPAETIQPSVIADIYFLHDRGKWNTLYWVCYMGSLMLGPIVAGPMADHIGWRNFWWLNVAMLGVSLAMVVFMFPETKWHRLHPNEIARSFPTSSANDLKAFTEKIENTADIQQVPTAASFAIPDLEATETAARDPHLGKGKPSKTQWALFQKNAHPLKSIILDLWIPWKLFAFPIVEFASFVASWSCSSFLTINLTQAQAFAAPSYSFSSQSIGFMNFAILIGALIGLLTAGPLSDWVSAYYTHRNNGIREPEMRLPAMVPYVLIMLLGNIMVSVGWDKHWSWEPIVIIGFACAGIQVAALPSIVSTYAVDSYKPVAGSLFVSITVNKNLWGWGYSKFLNGWAARSGFVAPIMTNAGLITLWCLFGILFYYKGKTFRRWSKNSSVHLM
ncbi:hypothetical protein H2201_004056 [Coniosporium apollinis]|uniref:Major facilitator superfamily (MFS) profile domain-containing protein n=1 Tax=Coniosporium apollinis TaxID=61459 RepID=A0ABQ9P0K7_9PEZI|nr:hypothetical protein H2201_004056 [Coniosporium apollinis]